MQIIRNSSLARCVAIIMMVLPLLVISCKDKPINTDRVETNPTNSATSSIKTTEVSSEKKTILFFGDSLTAGFGLNEEESFPSLIQNRVDSLGLDYTVINAGLSGETSSNGKSRIDWVLQNQVDIFVLGLGANDMLRGLDIEATDQNLRDILRRVNEKYPDAKFIIAGMQAPPNMGQDYVNQFNEIFVSLSKEFEAGLIPFLLEGVAGKPSLNLADAKHPNAKGQKIVADNVWHVLSRYL